MDAGLDAITPIVLVGGRSVRFGADKLLHEVGGRPLVCAPIEALRAVFGRRVATVGACDARVAALADLAIPDPYADAGPMGGIVAALEHARGSVMVLAGDLPGVGARTVRSILEGAAGAPDAIAAVGRVVTGGEARLEPCIALYRPSSLPLLRAALDRGERALHRVLLRAPIAPIDLDAEEARNVNTPSDARGEA